MTLLYLHLFRNYIGDAGAIALSQNTTLQMLDVVSNPIGILGHAALKASTIIDLRMDGEEHLKAGARQSTSKSDTNP